MKLSRNNLLFKLYDELRRYGDMYISRDFEQNNTRVMFFHYKEANYEVYMQNGEVFNIQFLGDEE
jgi:hypothetical protein